MSAPEPTNLTRDQIPPLLMAMIAAQMLRDNGTPGTPETARLWRDLSYFIACYEVKIPKRMRLEIEAAAQHARD